MIQTYRDFWNMALSDSALGRDLICEGMVTACLANGRRLEVKNMSGRPSGEIVCFGCGGWLPGRKETLRWVGLDFDVGHGLLSCASVEEAERQAREVRALVGGAAVAHRSKNGFGVHLRVLLCGGLSGGRALAPIIAKWLASKAGVSPDRAATGRQSFDFWSARPGPRAFELVSPCLGVWRPPLEALVAPKTTSPEKVLGCGDVAGLSERTQLFLVLGAEEGKRSASLFASACDVCGTGAKFEEALALLLPPALSSGLEESEAEATIRSAYSKPRRMARSFFS